MLAGSLQNFLLKVGWNTASTGSCKSLTNTLAMTDHVRYMPCSNRRQCTLF